MENRAGGIPTSRRGTKARERTEERQEAGRSMQRSQVRSLFQGGPKRSMRRTKKMEVVTGDHSKYDFERTPWAENTLVSGDVNWRRHPLSGA